MQGTGSGVGRILGIIDLGSNSAHLMVVRIAPNGVFAVLNRVKHMLRLGENAFQERRLQEEAMQRAFHVLHSFGAMCASYGAQEVITVATSAVRDAHNAQEFIQRAYEATGLAVTVVSGQEEARLIYLGVSSGLPHSLGQRLFMDIGGGSTELAVGNSLDHACLESLKLGCVRLDNQFLQGREKPVSDAEFAAMRNFVRMEASHSLQRVSAYDITELVGSSGTIQTLHALGYRLERGAAPGPDETTLTLDNLRRTARYICSLPMSKRKELPGVSPRRAEVLVPGAAIHTGRLDVPGMARILLGSDLCVDATHPYAAEASRNIREAAQSAGVPYRRLLRRESDLPDGCLCAGSAEEAARLLEGREGNILLTTGAKELSAF
uniref:precorrin-6A/cobalt-precorrin-6A reductase n=1 Tax=uncultured Desulfovibrio sp. TaxID=167968 RepID=UPI00260871F7